MNHRISLYPWNQSKTKTKADAITVIVIAIPLMFPSPLVVFFTKATIFMPSGSNPNCSDYFLIRNTSSALRSSKIKNSKEANQLLYSNEPTKKRIIKNPKKSITGLATNVFQRQASPNNIKIESLNSFILECS